MIFAQIPPEAISRAAELALESFGVPLGQLDVSFHEVIARRLIQEMQQSIYPWPTDGNWQKLRKALFAMKPTCEFQGCARKATQAHHRHYGSLGREQPEDMAALCWLHHMEAHSEEGWCKAKLDGLWVGEDGPPIHRRGFRHNGWDWIELPRSRDTVPREPKPELDPAFI